MPDFVIVGSDGTEHHFPEGMDPKAAIQVVKNGELKAANARPLSEPTTFAAGAAKGANDYATELGQGMFESAAHPKTAGDIAGLLLPTTLGAGGMLKGLRAVSESEPMGNKMVRGGVNLTRKGTEAAGKAADAIPATSVYAPGKLPLKMVQGAGRMLPEERTMLGVDSNLPNKSGYKGPDVRPHEAMPEGNAPVEVETAQDALARKTQTPTGAVQTDRTPYGGVEVPYKLKKPRMGKMVDNPYGKDTPLDEVLQGDLEGVQRSPSDTRSTGKADKMADTASGTDSLEELLNALHGEDSPLAINADGHGTAKPFFNAREVSGIQGKTGQMLPSQDLAEEAASLRRMKGSRDAGSAMFPDLAPAERGGLVKKLAPGPSQTPLEAEARINSAAQKAKGDIPSLLLAMLTGGGGALAARQTVPDSTLGLPE